MQDSSVRNGTGYERQSFFACDHGPDRFGLPETS
jgi:hypothetical protein